jgi:poly(3-hydroxybutyrate) depolymerase
VVVLHGSDDTALNIAKTTDMEEVARQTTGFLAVFPEMAAGPGGDSWGFADPSEIAFFHALVEHIDSEYALRRDQVYVCGHSNGGTMALFLQNNMPDVFSGAAAVEGGIGHLEDWDEESDGRPTMLVWNHNDAVLAEYGGEQLFQDTVSKLRRHNNTEAWPAFTLPLTSGTSEILFAEKNIWSHIPRAPLLHVISWESKDPTHKWLSPKVVPGTTLDASWLVWEFFAILSGWPSQGK